MTTSVASKMSHVTPLSEQYSTEQVSVIVRPNGCDQGQAAASEVNVMEITEVEYTHLQEIIQSHMEAEAAEQNGAGEVKLNPPSGERNNCRATHTSPVCQLNGSNEPVIETQYTLPVPNNKSNNNQGTDNVQEMNTTLYSETAGTDNVEERTPARYGEVPSSVLEKLKCTVHVARDRRSHRRMPPRAARPNPPARVCLEKRFNCSPCDLKKQQGAQAAVLNTCLSLLQQSMDMPGIAMHSQPENWTRTERACVVNSYEGNPPGPARGQGLSHFSELLEAGKHEAFANKTFSSSYSSNTAADSALRSSCVIYAIDEQRAASMEIESMGKTLKPATICSPKPLQVRDPNIFQNKENWRPAYPRASHKPRRTGPAVEMSERKARHNSKERERRKRIRLCCDELKLLVPFCNPETDKATTLQWTTAFLKYISEIYGDSLKQDFHNAFCNETSIRIEPSYIEDTPDCENSK